MCNKDQGFMPHPGMQRNDGISQTRSSLLAGVIIQLVKKRLTSPRACGLKRRNEGLPMTFMRYQTL